MADKADGRRGCSHQHCFWRRGLRKGLGQVKGPGRKCSSCQRVTSGRFREGTGLEAAAHATSSSRLTICLCQQNGKHRKPSVQHPVNMASGHLRLTPSWPLQPTSPPRRPLDPHSGLPPGVSELLNLAPACSLTAGRERRDHRICSCGSVAPTAFHGCCSICPGPSHPPPPSPFRSHWWPPCSSDTPGRAPPQGLCTGGAFCTPYTPCSGKPSWPPQVAPPPSQTHKPLSTPLLAFTLEPTILLLILWPRPRTVRMSALRGGPGPEEA